MSDVIDDDPATLAGNAGLSLDQYALARMIASEVGSGATAAVKVACGECARNKAKRRGVTVAGLLLRSRTHPEADGRFSRQALGKWASTYQTPSRDDIACAGQVLDGSNLTGGALDFFDPKVQDSGWQGKTKLRLSATSYIKARAKEGLQWVGVIEGVNAKRLMVFVPVPHADPSDALAMLDGGGGAPDTVDSGDGVADASDVSRDNEDDLSEMTEKTLLTQIIDTVTGTLGITVLVFLHWGL